MDETGLLAVYDWDSLSNAAEVVAVGQAAATWSAVDGSKTAPGANEIATYVARLEHYCRSAPYNLFNFFDFWV